MACMHIGCIISICNRTSIDVGITGGGFVGARFIGPANILDFCVFVGGRQLPQNNYGFSVVFGAAGLIPGFQVTVWQYRVDVAADCNTRCSSGGALDSKS